MNDNLTVDDLPITQPDDGDALPLYRQIEDDLRRMIATGVLAPGSTIPTELQLSQAYGVGRQTIRFALSRLVTDNLITRHAGRGSFVTLPSDRMKFYLDRSFTRQMEELGMAAHSRILDLSAGEICDRSPEPLRQFMGEACLNLVRLRFGDDEPIGIQATVLLTRDCPNIDAADFTVRSLYDVLATDYRLPIAEIVHTISATVANDLQASLLQVARNAPLLVVNTTAYLENGDAIEYTTSYYRADKYEYSTSHKYAP